MMMPDKSDIRGFYHFAESYYNTNPRPPGEPDDVMFGWYDPDGQVTSAECKMSWHDLGGKWHPQLNMSSDSWGLLASFRDVFDALALRDGQDIQPKEFCAMLLDLGFRDLTARKSPFPDKRESLRQSAAAKLSAEELAALRQYS
jgi:hypothetical protein